MRFVKRCKIPPILGRLPNCVDAGFDGNISNLRRAFRPLRVNIFPNCKRMDNPPAGSPCPFLPAVTTPPQVWRLAAHFAQNRSEIEGSVQIGDRPNSQRSMQPPAGRKRRNSQRSGPPHAVWRHSFYHRSCRPVRFRGDDPHRPKSLPLVVKFILRWCFAARFDDRRFGYLCPFRFDCLQLHVESPVGPKVVLKLHRLALV